MKIDSENSNNIYLYAYDLSLDCTGIAIFNMETFEPIYITSIKTNEKQNRGERLHEQRNRMIELYHEYTPIEICIERGFSRFPTATQSIFTVHGIVNELYYNIKQFYYPPKLVKERIVSGNATKKDVRIAIELAYPNIEFKNEDESDAFSVGIAHLN